MTPRQALFAARMIGQRSIGIRPRKTFMIGFNKTGTSSMHRLLRSLGFRAYHGLAWHDLSQETLFRDHDCFSDGFPQDWKTLYARYPTARFVLNTRRCDDWIMSRLGHIARSKAAGEYTGGKSWGLWDDTREAVVSWIGDWHTHHFDVLEFFRDKPGQLLVVNYTDDPDAAGTLARFVGFRGAVDKPKKNIGTSAPDPRHADLLAQACRDLGLDRAALSGDLLLPALAGAVGRTGREPDAASTTTAT